jgi:hypothetical protein
MTAPCPKCGRRVPCRCYVPPAGDTDKFEYELEFKDGLKMLVKESTFSRAIATGAYQRLLAGGETHRQLTVKKGRRVKENRQLSDDDEEALVSDDEIRALAEIACQKSNGPGWNTMWSGDQEAQIESWIEGYKAGSGRPYFTILECGWGEVWKIDKTVEIPDIMENYNNKQMITYKVVREYDLKRLQDFVNSLIKRGWSLQGGVVVEGYSGYGVAVHYLQTLVKVRKYNQPEGQKGEDT